MKKIFFISALLCASMMSFAIDWSSIAFLGNGSGDPKNDNMYKVAVAEGQSVVNVQQPGFASEPGIYTTFAVAIDDNTKAECSLPADKYAIQGAGMVMYLSAFTAKETEVKVKDNIGGEYVFTVYYENGVATAIENAAVSAKAVKTIENGQLVIIKNGVRYNVAGQEMK